MVNFIKVTADSCDEKGIVRIGQKVPRTELLLNNDLIGAIRNKEVLLKGTNILHVGKSYYTNIRLLSMISKSVPGRIFKKVPPER
jgi:hypothetical protein